MRVFQIDGQYRGFVGKHRKGFYFSSGLRYISMEGEFSDDDDEILGGLKDVRGKRVKRFGEVNTLPYSSKEAKIHIDNDIRKMSKHLGKASQQCIKIIVK